jgi:hypothetical protein
MQTDQQASKPSARESRGYLPRLRLFPMSLTIFQPWRIPFYMVERDQHFGR